MPIALIRHAAYQQPDRVPSAWLPHALSEEGRLQSLEAAAKILRMCSQYAWTLDPAIDCSRMRRAWQTASILAGELAQQTQSAFSVHEYEALAERGVGAFANLATQTIEQMVSDDPRYDALPAGWKRASDFRLPVQGAESLSEAGRRVVVHLNAQSCSEGVLKLCVGHGGAFRHAAKELGLLNAAEVASWSMFHAEPVVIARASGHWKHVAGRWKPRQESTAHD